VFGVTEDDTWMTLLAKYLEHDVCKLEEEKVMRQQCVKYTDKCLISVIFHIKI